MLDYEVFYVTETVERFPVCHEAYADEGEGEWNQAIVHILEVTR
ncbi:predicted protein [Botrytis cinerea T4]|uniref:Uncharacterized protein n=1 Tax=Botryotinia fuckeliana (strain T4) TaxID=999810 RepID=G2YFB6_BOTF4|nr:predicted protein [Botrytis cinerea T4]